MSAHALQETVRGRAIEVLPPIAGQCEHRFDLTRSETHEGLVLHCRKSSVEAVEQFIAKAIQEVLTFMDVAPPQYRRELERLEIQVFTGRLGDTSAWQRATPCGRHGVAVSAAEFESHAASLRDAECIYYLHQVGPSPVQEFVVAHTPAEYVAVYWYTSG